MTRFVNLFLIIGMTLGLAHCALGPGDHRAGSSTFDTFEADVFEEATPSIEEAHENDPGEYNPGSVGEEPKTTTEASEIQDEELVEVGEDSDEAYTVESYCKEERNECEKGAEPIVRAVCKEEYEDCVAPSNCEVQLTVCLLNQNAPDTCQRQFDQCE